MGIRKALPMSLRVSLRARTFMLGATAGIWVGDRASNPASFWMRVMAVSRRSSTIVLSSRMATSTMSSLERRRLDLRGRIRGSVWGPIGPVCGYELPRGVGVLEALL